MNARGYRVNFSLSPLDFPPIIGLAESSLFYNSEPRLINNKVVLIIAKTYVLTDMDNKQHPILTAQSVYEIPPNEIESREDIYEFYKDATQALNEAYQYARTQMPSLINIVLATPPIENYKGEIDRVFDLLNSQN